MIRVEELLSWIVVTMISEGNIKKVVRLQDMDIYHATN